MHPPAMLYGAETWATTKVREEKIVMNKNVQSKTTL